MQGSNVRHARPRRAAVAVLATLLVALPIGAQKKQAASPANPLAEFDAYVTKSMPDVGFASSSGMGSSKENSS